jgi:hypothetical protein
MHFFFLNSNAIQITAYSYGDFDQIIHKFGYALQKDASLHQYYDWAKIKYWKFGYEALDNHKMQTMFERSVVFPESEFYVRLNNPGPIVKIASKAMASMLEDLNNETDGMGWEAISTDGKYILEFTDDSQYLAISNFLIDPVGQVFNIA